MLPPLSLPHAGLPAGQSQEPQLLLGHFCAILTSLALSAGGRFVVTTDRLGGRGAGVMVVGLLAGSLWRGSTLLNYWCSSPVELSIPLSLLATSLASLPTKPWNRLAALAPATAAVAGTSACA